MRKKIDIKLNKQKKKVINPICESMHQPCIRGISKWNVNLNSTQRKKKNDRKKYANMMCQYLLGK